MPFFFKSHLLHPWAPSHVCPLQRPLQGSGHGAASFLPAGPCAGRALAWIAPQHLGREADVGPSPPRPDLSSWFLTAGCSMVSEVLSVSTLPSAAWKVLGYNLHSPGVAPAHVDAE